MSIVGYARVSTVDQDAGHEAQLAALKAAGCDEIFEERVSSVDMAGRAKLTEAMRYVRKGDVFVVTKLDRLARNISHLMQIVDDLKSKGAALRILDLGIDTGSATGELILTLLGGIAQFERSIMLERQREGIARAKREGRLKGRAPSVLARAAEIMALIDAGVGPTDVARQLGVGRKSVYRVMDHVRRGADMPDITAWPALERRVRSGT